MPIRITNSTTPRPYASPFVGKAEGPVHVIVDVSTLTAAHVDEKGYLKPGVVLTINGTVPGANNTARIGVVPEPIKVAANNTGLSTIPDSDNPMVVLLTLGTLNRDIAEDLLERGYTADELAALNGVGSRILLTRT